MKKVKPDFADGDIEFRIKDNEIFIYGTPVGLKKLIGFCERLLNDPSNGHIHLEDYEVLTANSQKGTIAVFD